MAASGGGQRTAAVQWPAAVLGGGACWKFTGERQNALPCTKLDRKKTKPKLRKRETHLGLEKKENSMTQGDRPAGGGSGFLPWATAWRERVGSSGERCGLKLCSGSAFYRSRREGEGAPEAVELGRQPLVPEAVESSGVAVSEGEGTSQWRRLIYRGSVGKRKGRGRPGGGGAWRGHG
jgi:hypothetical protein